MKRRIFSIYQQEFGRDLVRTVWRNRLLKLQFPELKIHAVCPFFFPKEIWTQFCTTYHYYPYNTDTIVRKLGISLEELRGREVRIDQLYKQITDFNYSFDLSTLSPSPSPIGRPYVCFIPQVSERWQNPHHCDRYGRSAPYASYLRYRKYLNEKGVQTVALGCAKSMGLLKTKNFDPNELADYCYFLHDFEGLREEYLLRQLSLMKNALTTIGMGGGALVAPTFGLPCISVDEFFYRHFSKKALLEQRPSTFILDKVDKSPEGFEQTDRFVFEALAKTLQTRE